MIIIIIAQEPGCGARLLHLSRMPIHYDIISAIAPPPPVELCNSGGWTVIGEMSLREAGKVTQFEPILEEPTLVATTPSQF